MSDLRAFANYLKNQPAGAAPVNDASPADGAAPAPAPASNTSTTVLSPGSPNPSFRGQKVTWTAQVTLADGTPATGTVTFDAIKAAGGLMALGRVPLSGGKASVAVALPTPTKYTIKATYPDTGGVKGSHAEQPQEVKLSPDQMKNQQDNVAKASKEFGSGGTDFNKLTGADTLDAKQKAIFDKKLKQAIEATPGSQDGAIGEGDLKQVAQMVADQANALAKTKLGDAVNKLAAESPTLKDNLVDLQNRDWTIKPVAAGQESYTDRPNKIIYVAQNASAKDVAETLAHETGHAEYAKPADPSVEDPSPTVAKGRDYIRRSVENSLLDEGQAQIVACQTAKELEAKGETGVSIPGNHSAAYKAVYVKIAAGTLTMDQGRKEMAKIMGTEVVSGPGGSNYVDYYSGAPCTDWNTKHPEAPIPVASGQKWPATRVSVFP